MKLCLVKPRAMRLGEFMLCLSVSRDEEYVRLRMVDREFDLDLGARNHNFLLLTLARRRLADAEESLPPTTCGWTDIEELAHDPSMGPPKLNIDICRIRKQFLSRGILDGFNIIERRVSSQQIRIGADRISIVTL
ncbi:MAG: hypothetical protein ABSC94_06210 [Polyangiaceae bacterium]